MSVLSFKKLNVNLKAVETEVEGGGVATRDLEDGSEESCNVRTRQYRASVWQKGYSLKAAPRPATKLINPYCRPQNCLG